MFVVSLLVIASILISIPAIQIKIIRKITEPVFQEIGHKLSLDFVSIRWFDTILISGIEIQDTKDHAMIKVDRLILDFKLTELLANNSIYFDKAILQGVNVEMLDNAPDNKFNINYFIDAIRIALAPKTPRADPRIFKTDKIIITNGRFKMYRNDVDVITTRFDQNHFTLLDVDARLSNFVLVPGVIDFSVQSLQCQDSASLLQVKDLVTNFKNTRQSMVFQNMELTAGNSRLVQSMVFNFKQPSSLRYFVDSVNLTVNVKESQIYSKDLGIFAPSVKKYNDYYRLSGFMEGPVNRFNAQDITLRFGRNSVLRGYVSMNGLPFISETFIDAKITEGEVQTFDLGPYISNATLESIMKFGVVNLAGGFSGFPGDFVSNASFNTQIGNFNTDINLKLGASPNEVPSYSGKLETQGFDLGILLSDTLLYQQLDMKGSIRGSGFSRDKARFYLISDISRIGINGYDYQNISTNASMAEGFFNGNLIIGSKSEF